MKTSGVEWLGDVPASAARAPAPRDRRSGDRLTRRRRDHAGQSLLHIVPQRRVDSQRGRFRTRCCAIGVPLRGRGRVLDTAASGRGIPSQCARDRRWGPSESSSARTDTMSLGTQERELFTLSKREVPAAKRRSRGGEVCRRHAPSSPEPPRAHHPRHACLGDGRLRIQPARDRLPKLHAILASTDRWPPLASAEACACSSRISGMLPWSSKPSDSGPCFDDQLNPLNIRVRSSSGSSKASASRAA